MWAMHVWSSLLASPQFACPTWLRIPSLGLTYVYHRSLHISAYLLFTGRLLTGLSGRDFCLTPMKNAGAGITACLPYGDVTQVMLLAPLPCLFYRLTLPPATNMTQLALPTISTTYLLPPPLVLRLSAEQ